jgi:hypothetical protein
MWLRPGGQYDQNLRDLARAHDADRERADPRLPAVRRTGCLGTVAALVVVAGTIAGIAWIAGALLRAVLGA